MDRRYPIGSNKKHIDGAIFWIFNAQDNSGSDGVAVDYSFSWGWGSPYPETTGYIICSLINYTKVFPESKLNDEIMIRTKKMAEWLVRVQNKNGSYNEGVISSKRASYVDNKREIRSEAAFETAQVMGGLLAAYKEFNKEYYLNSAKKAANWLVEKQGKEGTWRASHQNKPRTYDVYIGWRLLEVYLTVEDKKYLNSAIKIFDYASQLQNENGFFMECSHLLNRNPWTHGIGYTLEGYIEGFSILGNLEISYLEIAKKTANKLLKIYHIGGFESVYNQEKGFLPANFDKNWKSKAKYMCLPGNAQIALSWLKLFKITGDYRYLNAGIKVNKDLKSLQNLRTNNNGIYGGIKGSHPIYGHYTPFRYPNWAAKFFIDLLLEETLIMKKEQDK